MKNRFCLFLIIAILGGGATAEAQQRGKIPRLGILEPGASNECLYRWVPTWVAGTRLRGWAEHRHRISLRRVEARAAP